MLDYIKCISVRLSVVEAPYRVMAYMSRTKSEWSGNKHSNDLLRFIIFMPVNMYDIYPCIYIFCSLCVCVCVCGVGVTGVWIYRS